MLCSSHLQILKECICWKHSTTTVLFSSVWQEWEIGNNTFTAMDMREGEKCGDIHRTVKVEQFARLEFNIKLSKGF